MKNIFRGDHKKHLKILLIVIGVIVSIVLIDTLQVIVFKNSPIISIRTKLEDDDSYVDKGILINTFYCTKDEDIVTVSYHSKGNKFTCPIDNAKEYNERAQNLINLLKKNMIEKDILDEENLESFEVLKIRQYGYYRDTPVIKHIQFEFDILCKDGTNKCMQKLLNQYDIFYNNYAIIWAYTDENKIYELSSGISININADYEFESDIIY